MPSCCQPDRLCPREGDVAVCVRCDQWWWNGFGYGAFPVERRTAAAIAAEPLPAALVLAALNRAAAELQPDPDY